MYRKRSPATMAKSDARKWRRVKLDPFRLSRVRARCAKSAKRWYYELKADAARYECYLLKARAHKIVQRALAAGILSRPAKCDDCGASVEKPDAHHEDYAKPLTVRWVCRVCHTRIHHDIKGRRNAYAPR